MSSPNPSDIPCPYSKVQYFIQEKYKIAGLRPGSGNTANIGSFATKDITELSDGNGPFAPHGEDVFEAYWRQYARDGSTKCDSVEEFLRRRGTS